MNSDERECPFCGEIIKKGAKKCRFCDSWLNDETTKIEKNGNSKICPYCSESIPANTLICPHCNEYINQTYRETPHKKSPIGKILFLIFLIVAISGAAVYAYFWYNDPIRKADRLSSNYYTLAKEQEKAGNNKEAISYYKKALYEKFDLDDVKVTLVKLCIKEKDMACVEEYIDAAYKINPKDNQLKFYYASTILDEPNSAVPLLKSVVDKEPNNYLANKYLGSYYYDKKEYKTALKYLKKSYDLKDNFENNTGAEKAYEDIDDEWKMIANSYIMLDEYTNAINILDDVIDKTGNYDARELKKSAEEKRETYLYNKSRTEYYKQQQKASSATNANEAARRQWDEINRQGIQSYNNSYNNNYSSNSSQSAATDDPIFGPYMRELQRRIKMNWDPPKGNESKRVVLIFKIAKDGRLLSCRVSQSSGIPAADQAALRAVELTAPFQPLPSGFAGQSIDIAFTFDYNVFNNRY